MRISRCRFAVTPVGSEIKEVAESPPAAAANQEQDGDTGIADYEIDKAGPPAASGKIILRSRAADADPRILSLPDPIDCGSFRAATAVRTGAAGAGARAPSLSPVHCDSVVAGADRVRDIGARVIEPDRRCVRRADQRDCSHGGKNGACEAVR
jgi:hypothetical protein